MTQPSVPSHVPASATAGGDGVVLGTGPVTVDAYIDFLCPFCRQFELSSGSTLAGLVASGQISLAYHPMNFLDPASNTHYSTRAAASSGCASDGGRFAEYAHALFVSQPPEGSAGLTDAQLAGLAGVGRPARAGVPILRAERPVPGVAVVRDRSGDPARCASHADRAGQRGASGGQRPPPIAAAVAAAAGG